jgi:multidrug resistance efflux pump
MTPERFRVLLDSCGADLRRWPEAARDAARALLASDPGLRAAHAEAALLDRALDAHEIAAPGAALIDRIAVAAGSAASAGRARSWWRPEPFWPRARWALTGLAGAVAGALVVSVALGDSYPAAATDWQKRGTAFTDRPADWSEE